MKNKEWLAEATSNMHMLKNQNRKVYIGQEIRVSYKNKVERFIRTGVIEKLEKHYLVVKYEKFRECYSYADIVTSLYSDKENYKFLVKVGKEWTRITKEMIS
ncbi:hypothetical protein [Clostridium sp.]|uniref:hypothetical protein n=1 Tax=Clostridium sp. TaxID=1506 RepID=UPI00261B61D1|nr:hypothetical protein [Clostridium sp.]